jgi:hypothetical protein
MYDILSQEQWCRLSSQLHRRLRLGKIQASWGKKIHETPSQQKKLGVVAGICHSSYNSHQKIEESQLRSVGEEGKPALKNNQSIKGWCCGFVAGGLRQRLRGHQTFQKASLLSKPTATQ